MSSHFLFPNAKLFFQSPRAGGETAFLDLVMHLDLPPLPCSQKGILVRRDEGAAKRFEKEILLDDWTRLKPAILPTKSFVDSCRG